MQEFDLVVIGTGAAGNTAALHCKKRGWSVAIVDSKPFGGTCQLRGCDPKKILVGAAHALDAAQKMRASGVFAGEPRIDWAKLMAFKRTFTDPVPAQREKSYSDAGIVPMHGRARFVDEQTLDVGGERVKARRILIATGAKAAHFAPGDDLLLDNEAFLSLEQLPQKLLFVGGGFISLEFAHVAVRAGANVQIMDFAPRILMNFDAEVVEPLEQTTRELGIELHFNARVTKIVRDNAKITVLAEVDGKEQSFSADAAVHGAGRAADLDDLGLEAANVERTKRGVKVNEFFQSTSNPHVYSAGDAADGGGLQLTPVAGTEGEIVAANMVDGNTKTADFAGLASIVYTIPPLATAGLTEEAARKQNLAIDVVRGDMSSWYTLKRLNEKRGTYKVIVEQKSRKILGATIFGPLAEEQINVLSLAIRQGLDTTAITETLFAYPTGASDLQSMFE
ncbi:MAG: NAD(P)/FAD-dependent oxidoreductase [Candidatus Eremiobacteraeota bacterium]|nr:NAD(P)/FAD-dependent oxidoreductase [Candidatus Eremiobacteraeota bacterium]